MPQSSANPSLFATLWTTHKPVLLILFCAISLCLFSSAFVIHHFLLGSAWPVAQINNTEQIEQWGQIGDFLGGLLNPAFSFIAFLMLLYTLKIQNDELIEARKESRIARKQAKAALKLQALQTQLFERQGFESAFFGLLSSHIKITDSIQFTSDNQQPYNGHEALVQISRQHGSINQLLATPDLPRALSLIRARARSLINQYQGEIGHYFRSLQQLLSYIDSYGKTHFAPKKSCSVREIKEQMVRDRANYFEQLQYANMLRAQLSASETELLFLYCLTPQGRDLKQLVEKYAFFNALNLKQLKHYPDILQLYSKSAYKDARHLSHEDFLQLLRPPSRLKKRRTAPI